MNLVEWPSLIALKFYCFVICYKFFIYCVKYVLIIPLIKVYGKNVHLKLPTALVLSVGQTLIAGESLPPSSNQTEVQLKFLLTGLLSGLPLPPFSIRMCPPLTTKNINHYQPLLAVGR